MTQDEERKVVQAGLPLQKRQNFTAVENRVGEDTFQTLSLMKPRLYFYRRRRAGS
jgi:hypothetical protein